MVTGPPDLFIRVPFQLHGEHTVLQPFRRIELIVHIVISVLPGTHFYLNPVKRLRVYALPKDTTSKQCPKIEREKHDISLKILHQAGLETARQSDIWKVPRSKHFASLSTARDQEGEGGGGLKNIVL